MAWRKKLLDQLAAGIPCGYQRHGPPASEPTCLAAIALAQSGRAELSMQALQWLASIQNDDGSVGPSETLKTPGWPTALALVADVYTCHASGNDILGLCGQSSNHRALPVSPLERAKATQWLVDAMPSPTPKTSDVDVKSIIGHDATLVGWPWVTGTHSWVEPTALAVLALKATARGEHARTRDGVRLLVDRLLPDGGCNYGNTAVMGQMLRPHVQPTGLALLALHGEADRDGRVSRSLEYLEREASGDSAAASLAYAVWALARYGKTPRNASAWLSAAARRRTTVESPLRMALLLLADAALECGGLPPLAFSNRCSGTKVPNAANAH